jgi:sugar phosphate isomerase/epimerase
MQVPEPTDPQRLIRSFKGCYPFSLGTTSFIYQDSWIENARLLTPYLDEIELLLFESRNQDSLPTAQQIRELAAIAKDQGGAYNIHLPMDIYLGHEGALQRQAGVETLKKVLALTAPLKATTNTLHLNLGQEDMNPQAIAAWQGRVTESLEQLLATGVDGRLLSIETLDYPFEWAIPIVQALDLSVCLDLGHLLVHDIDIETVFTQFQDLTVIIHLHGVEDRNDHLALDRLSATRLQQVVNILRQFTGTVSLEVFSFENLFASLICLEKILK